MNLSNKWCPIEWSTSAASETRWCQPKVGCVFLWRRNGALSFNRNGSHPIQRVKPVDPKSTTLEFVGPDDTLFWAHIHLLLVSHTCICTVYNIHMQIIQYALTFHQLHSIAILNSSDVPYESGQPSFTTTSGGRVVRPSSFRNIACFSAQG